MHGRQTVAQKIQLIETLYFIVSQIANMPHWMVSQNEDYLLKLCLHCTHIQFYKWSAVGWC